MKLAANGSLYFATFYRAYKYSAGAGPYDSSFFTISEIRKYKGVKSHTNWDFVDKTFFAANSEINTVFPHTPNNYRLLRLKYFENGCGSFTPIVIEHDTCYRHNWIYLPNGDSSLTDSLAFAPGKSGTYYIKLKAQTLSGFYTWYWDSVDFFKPPVAAFVADTTVGCRFVSYRFTDKTQNDTEHIAKGRWWHWRFGDGTDTFIGLPYHQVGSGSVSHTYTKPGKYTISLVFGNGFCTDSITQTQQVEILDAPKPGINALTHSHCLPFTLVVDDTVTNAVKKRYEWGDGKDTASPPAPLRWRGEHTYADSGSYWVKQTLTSATGCVTKDSLLLQLFQTPKINLGNDTFLCEGEAIVIPANAGILDSVMAGLTRHLWNTGDTTTSLSISKPGLYWLQATNGLCVVRDSLLISDAGGLCKLSFYLVPNPAQDNTELRGYARQQATLSLAAIDMAGRELFTTKPLAIEGSFAIPITTAHWAAGMYVLRLQVAGENSPRQMKLVVAP